MAAAPLMDSAPMPPTLFGIIAASSLAVKLSVERKTTRMVTAHSLDRPVDDLVAPVGVPT